MKILFILLIHFWGLQTPETAPHMGHQKRAAYAADDNKKQWDTECDYGEYLVEHICCKACPAGTYMHQKCQNVHDENVCRNCTAGKDYTSGPNALAECIRCHHCRKDQIVTENCTQEKDTQCECMPGYYCHESENCEVCVQCRCPDGQKPQRNCDCEYSVVTNSIPTMNSSAVPKTKHASYLVLAVIVPISVVLGVVLIGLCWYKFKKKGSSSPLTSDQCATNNDACNNNCRPQEEEEHVGLVHCVLHNSETENSTLVKNSNLDDSDEEDEAIGRSIATIACSSRESSKESVPLALQETGCMEMLGVSQEERRELVAVTDDALQLSFDFVTEKVPRTHFKQLMRKLRLNGNTIEEAVHNNPYNVREQHYNMLLAWHSNTGKTASINMILDVLYKMELKCAAEAITELLIAENLYRYSH